MQLPPSTEMYSDQAAATDIVSHQESKGMYAQVCQ